MELEIRAGPAYKAGDHTQADSDATTASLPLCTLPALLGAVAESREKWRFPNRDENSQTRRGEGEEKGRREGGKRKERGRKDGKRA